MKETGSLNSKFDWQWLDGTEYSWRGWSDGQPDGDYGVAYMDSTIEWGERRREYESRFICKRQKLKPGIC